SGLETTVNTTLFETPLHLYPGAALGRSYPGASARARKRVILKGDVPSPINLPGLSFSYAPPLRHSPLPARGTGSAGGQTGPLGVVPPARRGCDLSARETDQRISSTLARDRGCQQKIRELIAE